MLHNKIDLTRHIPKNPLMKGIALFFSIVWLTGLSISFTSASLSIESAINNVIGTFQELRITTDGSPSGTTKVILNTGGIWVDSGALGGPVDGVLKLNSLGYITRGLISGNNIASGVITTGMLSFTITSWAGGSGTTTLSCGTGEALIGVSSGTPLCAPIIGTGDCSVSGFVLGWTSTGVIICSDASSFSGFTIGGSSLWLISGSTTDIYYGNIDTSFGNIGVGLDSPLAKLHVNGDFRVDTSAPFTLFATSAMVGINNSTPAAALDVNGSVRLASYAGAGIRNLGVDALGNIIITSGGVAGSSGLWQNGAAGVIYYNGGDVGIKTATPGATLHVSGDIMTNATYIVSDQSLKQNIVQLTGALSSLLQITGYSFNWISDNRADIGFLAQEVENVFPQLVKTLNDGSKALEYPNIIAVVVEAVKELYVTATALQQQYGNNATIESLYTQYNTNAATIESLSSRLDLLEAQINNSDVITTQNKGYAMCVQWDTMGLSLSVVKQFCNSTYLPFTDVRNALSLHPDSPMLQQVYDDALQEMTDFFNDNNL